MMIRHVGAMRRRCRSPENASCGLVEGRVRGGSRDRGGSRVRGRSTVVLEVV